MICILCRKEHDGSGHLCSKQAEEASDLQQKLGPIQALFDIEPPKKEE